MPVGKQTAMDIALAYREVEAAEKLLSEIEVSMSRRPAPDIRDAFGRLQDGLQLGIPHGSNGHTLYTVPWRLARPIIEAHIAEKRSQILILSETARAELSTPS